MIFETVLTSEKFTRYPPCVGINIQVKHSFIFVYSQAGCFLAGFHSFATNAFWYCDCQGEVSPNDRRLSL
jgi:hypothetical protein